MVAGYDVTVSGPYPCNPTPHCQYNVHFTYHVVHVHVCSMHASCKLQCEHVIHAFKVMLLSHVYVCLYCSMCACTVGSCTGASVAGVQLLLYSDTSSRVIRYRTSQATTPSHITMMHVQCTCTCLCRVRVSHVYHVWHIGYEY